MKDLDLVLNVICRLLVAFLAFIFLFGQAFVGNFEWFSTAAGIGGFAVAGLTGWPSRIGPLFNRIGIAGGALALIGVSFDIYDYYGFEQYPGNYYAWFIVLPFVCGIVYLMLMTLRGARLR